MITTERYINDDYTTMCTSSVTELKMKCRAGDKLPTDSAIEQVISVAEPKYKNLLRIAVLSGFRVSEITELSIRQGLGNWIDFDTGKIIISKQKNKRQNEPFILFPELREALCHHIAMFYHEIMASGGWLFFSKYRGSYKQLTRSTVLSMIQKYRLRAGLMDIYGHQKNGRRKFRFSMHSTRHYAINQWGKLCVEKKGIYDTNTISCLSRHKNLSLIHI